MTALRASPVVTITASIGLVLVAVLLFWQMSSLRLSISAADQHHWRQSFTFGIAWNYAHTTLDFLRPRMFLELQRSNIVAMEMPLYPFLASIFLRLTHDSALGPRLLSWVSFLVLIVVSFRMLGVGRAGPRDTWADRAGLFIALAVSPLVAAEFRSVQPEPLAAGFAAAAVCFFVRYRDTERTRDAALGAAMTTLAVLAKPVALGIIPGLIAFALVGKERWLRRALVVLGLMLPGLLIYLAWDKWAHRLLKTELDGLIVISIDHDPAAMLRNLRNPGYAREAFFHFLTSYAGSWWLVPAIFAGFYRSLADLRLRRFGIPFAIWLVGYLVELLAFGDRLHSNAYYFILAPMPIMFFGGVGFGGLVRALESREGRPPLTAFRVGLFLTLALPLGLLFATPAKWASSAHVDLGYRRNQHVWTDDLGLGLLFLLLLAAITLAPRVRPKRIPAWVGVPVVLAVLGSGVWAYRDARQFFRYYTTIDRRGGFENELGELRAAVNRYSGPNDRVFINESELVFFSYPLRNGFVLANTASKLPRAKSAHLYVHFDHGRFESAAAAETPPQMPGVLLERGRWWRLYCVNDGNCAPSR